MRPSRTTITRRARAATSGSCVTSTIVMPSAASAASSAIISSLARESRLPVGSSASISRGRVDQGARDRHPLLLPARELARVVVQALAQADAFERRRRPCAPHSRGGRPRRRSGSSTFSSAVVRASRLKLWNTKPSVRLRVSASAFTSSSRDVLAGEVVAGRWSGDRSSRGCSAASTCPSRTDPSRRRTRPRRRRRSRRAAPATSTSPIR